MTRLFRRPEAGLASWVSLFIFVVAYLSALSLVVAPSLLDWVVLGAR